MEKTDNRGRSIALIGLSGSGKSTIGPLLAEKLSIRYVDTDREIEREAGMPIHRIFSELGEAEFRGLEREQVRLAVQPPRSIISLGGGAVLSAENREVIWDACLVVWLHAEPDVLLKRLAAQSNGEERPLLSGTNPAEKLAAMLRQRAALYSLAHLRVDCNDREPEELADTILQQLAVANDQNSKT